jgi:DNA-binding beta-propeller fold protein YncE
MSTRIARAGVLLACLGTGSLTGQSYHLVHSYALGGDGGWDYITLDSAGHRLFIGRQNRIMVVDPGTGTLLAEIPGLERAHGVALAYAAGHGFATSGGDSSVVMFDLKSLAVLGRTTAAQDADAILFDPSTGHIFTFNGDAQSSTVIDAASGKRIGTVALGAKPEFGVAAGDGKLYVNLESTAEVAEIDAAGMRVTRTWSLAPCEAPTGLAIDPVHHRLFSGCRNGMMAISDAQAGKLVATEPIGRGVDGCRYDPATRLAFASNGDGTLSVVREVTPDSFVVAASVDTKRGARTMELDLTTHRVYTVTAEFGPAPAPTPERPRPRPGIVPGSFALLVLEP